MDVRERQNAPRKWSNQYVNLVQTKSEIVIAGHDDVTQEEKDFVSKKVAAYSPIYVELGAGSGNHLVARAQLAPTALWIGFELRFKRVFKTAEKAELRGLKNLISIRNKAQKVTDFFGRDSIDGVYVNFPDPWDKKRWHKNRMMRDPFLSAVVELLKPGGFIAYKTDHLGCFDELEGILEERKDGKITEITRDLYSCPEYLANNVETEFEQLFRRQKLPINYLRWVKQAECQEKIS